MRKFASEIEDIVNEFYLRELHLIQIMLTINNIKGST